MRRLFKPIAILAAIVVFLTLSVLAIRNASPPVYGYTLAATLFLLCTATTVAFGFGRSLGPPMLCFVAMTVLVPRLRDVYGGFGTRTEDLWDPISQFAVWIYDKIAVRVTETSAGGITGWYTFPSQLHVLQVVTLVFALLCGIVAGCLVAWSRRRTKLQPTIDSRPKRTWRVFSIVYAIWVVFMALVSWCLVNITPWKVGFIENATILVTIFALVLAFAPASRWSAAARCFVVIMAAYRLIVPVYVGPGFDQRRRFDVVTQWVWELIRVEHHIAGTPRSAAYYLPDPLLINNALCWLIPAGLGLVCGTFVALAWREGAAKGEMDAK